MGGQAAVAGLQGGGGRANQCACLAAFPTPGAPPHTTRPAPAYPHHSNVAEFNRGDLFVIRYRAVQQLLAEGAVELV